jgi:hypothetical protein
VEWQKRRGAQSAPGRIDRSGAVEIVPYEKFRAVACAGFGAIKATFVTDAA